MTLPRFPLGQVVATPGALAALAEAGDTPADLLRRLEFNLSEGYDEPANSSRKTCPTSTRARRRYRTARMPNTLR